MAQLLNPTETEAELEWIHGDNFSVKFRLKFQVFQVFFEGVLAPPIVVRSSSLQPWDFLISPSPEMEGWPQWDDPKKVFWGAT